MTTGNVDIKLDLAPVIAIATKLHGAKKGFPQALSKLVTEAGIDANKQMQATLPAQTGLPRSTFTKALRGKSGNGTYTITSHGGDVRMKFFKPHETAKGVVAMPWNRETLYPATFMRSGWWPKRGAFVSKTGAVLRRVGPSKYPLRGVRSGLFIPDEMVTGPSAAVFYGTAQAKLLQGVEYTLYHALG